MKKIIIVVMFLLIPLVVKADEVANLVSLTNKCSVITNDSLTIHVDVISLNDGTLSKLINEYELGMIDNQDNMEIEVGNFKSDYIKNIVIDNLKDNEGRSKIRYYISDDIVLKRNEILLSFDLKIKVLDSNIRKIYVLDNYINVSNDSNVCDLINGYKVNTIVNEVVKEKDDKVNYLIWILFGVSILEFILLLRKKC